MDVSDADKLAQFMSGSSAGFGDPALATDYILGKPHSLHPTATETWWYQFFIPELGLNGEVYFWVHTNLRTMSGGVWIFKGIKKHYLEAEHFNWKNHMPYPQVTEEGISAPEIGLTIKIVEPLGKQQVIYDDDRTDTHLRLEATALFPPICRTSNAHFEQPMHLTGTLRLKGEDLKIDCHANRDRSWGEPRYEDSMVHPNVAWCIGQSTDGKTGFLFNGADDPARDPIVASYGLSGESLLKDGWYLNNGELRRVVSISKRTKRGDDGMQPLLIECDFTDSAGDRHNAVGSIMASVLWSPWPNMSVYFGALARWTLDGATVCYGDSQELFWAESVKRILNR
jgi:hypothetical protein